MKAVAITVAALVAAFGLSAAGSSQTAYAAPESSTVTIQQGDTLDKIAKAQNTTYKRLYDANEQIKDPNLIYPGDNLRIPADGEQLPDRGLPAPSVPEASTQQTSQQQATTAPSVASGSVWDSLAQCESGGNWSINTGNGFYGGLQFTMSSWQAAGGSGSPQFASREEQIRVAQNLQAMQGWGAWPACSAKLGLR